MSASRIKNKTSSSGELEVRLKGVPPAEIESAPLPPEGNALSAELWGRTVIILAGNRWRRKRRSGVGSEPMCFAKGVREDNGK